MKRNLKKFGPRLTISLTTGDYDALNSLAQKDEVSVSWVVRRAVEEYLRGRRQENEPTFRHRIHRKPARLAAGRVQER